jgi:hypothetical protein
MKDLSYILKHLDRIKEGVSEGEIFKTEPSTDQRFELCIFEMLKGHSLISDRYLKELYERKYRGTKRSTINYDNRKRVFNLWSEEINTHNTNLSANQKTMFP